MLGDEDLGSPWKATARRVGWTLLSLVHLLFGLGLCVGSLVADGGEYGPYLIGVTCGMMFVLLSVCVQMMKGVRIVDGTRRRVRRQGATGIEIRLRRGPGICGELMLVCFVVMLCQFAGLSFRFVEVTPRRDAPSWSTTRRRQVRLLPKRWRRKVVRVGFWLFDHPERVLETLGSLRRQRDVARAAVLANELTLTYLVGDLEVSPLPSGR